MKKNFDVFYLRDSMLVRFLLSKDGWLSVTRRYCV